MGTIIKNLSEILPGIIKFRHELHRIPEIAGQEFKTQKAIRARLEKLDLEVLPPFIGTDTVAILQGGCGPGRNVTLRADIDALKILEANQVEYVSTHPGMMHACGHDGHTAMLMGAAEVLASRRNEFAGTVRFVWQPGEEIQAMARKLVAAGALENPRADLVTAIHGYPGMKLGTIGCRDGASEASCAVFKVTVHGKGGHSSSPNQAIDPLLIASTMVVELQSIISRRINPQHAAVLSVCRFESGQLANVIPTEAVFEGTIRAFDSEDCKLLEAYLRNIVTSVARAHNATVDIEYHQDYPVTQNWHEPTEMARRVIKRTFGEENYYEIPHPSMVAEDFAYYAQKYPSVYVKLGTGENSPLLHTANFDFPDEALPRGIGYFVEFALEALR